MTAEEFDGLQPGAIITGEVSGDWVVQQQRGDYVVAAKPPGEASLLGGETIIARGNCDLYRIKTT